MHFRCHATYSEEMILSRAQNLDANAVGPNLPAGGDTPLTDTDSIRQSNATDSNDSRNMLSLADADLCGPSKSSTHRKSRSLAHLFHSGPINNSKVSVTVVVVFLCLVFLPFLVNFVVFSRIGGHTDIQRISGPWLSALRDLVQKYDELRDQFQPHQFSADPVHELVRGRLCVQNWTTALQDRFREQNMSFAHPVAMKKILSKMVGGSWLPAFKRLEDVLGSPRNLTEFLGQVGSCAQNNVFLGAMACASLDDPALRFNAEGADAALHEAATYMLLTEQLTLLAVEDAPFADMLVEHLNDHFEAQGLLETGIYARTMEHHEFARDKYLSLKEGTRVMSIQRKSGKVDSELIEAVLQLNILEAALLDLAEGRMHNAMTGLLLAHQVEGLGGFASVSSDEQRTFSVALGREWADLYIAWNTAFVSALQPGQQLATRLSKLFIPSVLCSNRKTGGADFLYARTISLFLDLNYQGWDTPPGTLSVDASNSNASAAWGATVLMRSPWELPVRSDLVAMSHKLQRVFRPPQGLSLFSYLAASDFPLLSALSLLAAATLAAAALETVMAVLVWPTLSARVAGSIEWATELAYSLLLCVALFAQSAWGVPLMVLGLWRLGAPDLLAAFATACDPSQPITPGRRALLMLQGTALALHHAVSAFVICSVSVGYSKLNRDMLSVILPTAYQHLASVLRFQTPWGCRVVWLVLEAWWQVECFAFLQSDQPRHEHIALVTMLVAHYGYAIICVANAFVRPGGEDATHAAHTESRSCSEETVTVNGDLCRHRNGGEV